MLGFTCSWHGHRVTFHGSGMGMPSLSIYATELMRDFGVTTIIRVGSAGALQPDMGLRDLVIAMSAALISTPSRPRLRELSLALCADWGLLSAAVAAADARGLPRHVGQIHSADAFYDERSDPMEVAARHGVLAVEMEASELYTLAARYGARALAVLTVSDHIPPPPVYGFLRA